MGMERGGKDCKWAREAGAAYPVVCEWLEALAYPLLRVDVADCDVQCDQDHETQEDGPLDNEALLRWTVSFSVLDPQCAAGRWSHTLVYQYGTIRPFSTTKPSGALVGWLPFSDVGVACRCAR